MFFLYFMYLICMKKSNNIPNNCISKYINFNKHYESVIDYKISCPKNLIQRVNLANVSDIDSISIYNKSSVIINCPEQTNLYEHIKLRFFHSPYITFENHCNFSSIEIYDSPIFKFSKDSKVNVKKYVVHNHSYKLFFDTTSNNDFLENTKMKNKIILSNNYEDREYTCNSISIDLTSPNAFIICYRKSYDEYNVYLEVSYDDFIEYLFYVNEDIVFRNMSNFDDDIEKKLSLIIQSLSIPFENHVNVYYSDFLESKVLQKTADMFGSVCSLVSMNFSWWKYVRYYRYCAWYESVFESEFSFLENKFDDQVRNTYWRKICLNGDGQLYLQDENDYKIYVLPNIASWGVLIGIIVLILLIFILCLIFAYRRYKQKI